MNQETVPPASLAKKVHVETWGCQMNVADSETMLAELSKLNYRHTDDAEDADLVLLNTCHIREKARHKVVSRLGRLTAMKARRPGMKIAVAGCVAQAEGKKLLASVPAIDILFGPGKISELGRLLQEHTTEGGQQSALGFDKSSTPAATTASRPSLTGHNDICRYVNITQGCDNFCTFCVVPHTRGREISRLPETVLEETRTLISGGAKEICLLGQNVNSYGTDLVKNGQITPSERGAFVDLLTDTLTLSGLERLRFTTSNPHDFTKPLADLFFSQPEKMGAYLHLPVQSGNDEVLARMRRKVTAAEFYERVDWLRARDPAFALSTDLIVGFPGETDAQFADTMRLIENVRFSFVFAFKYSPRKHTAAVRFRDQVPEDVKTKRLAALMDVQNQITTTLNEAEIGHERDVLFQYESQKQPGWYYGRSEHYRLVKCRSERSIIGQRLPVTIVDANKTALEAQLV